MAEGWSNIALRLAVYVDLMVLFGVPLFATYALGPGDHDSWIRRRFTALAVAASVVGLALSALGLVAMAEQMAGASDVSAVTRHVVEMILTRTGAGFAWAVRCAALALCIVAAFAFRGRFLPFRAAGAVALATLAWTGHGAMDDGARGWLHLASDVVHLFAAGAWVGALVAFVTLSARIEEPAADNVELLTRTASGFARIGTAIVLALVVTGAINYVLIVGPTLHGLLTTLYGRLFAAKLALFVGMLALAGANRYLLTPALAAAPAAGLHRRAVHALRRSLWTEASVALLVLALVSWLGTLSPQP
jgi:putative copper resistance protein D